MKTMNNNEKLAKLAVNKSLLKEYSNSSNERIVYMNDNTEFQIQIFNPYSYVIGVSFKFNDNSEGSQLLVLKPGERVWLDRYLNNESKLLFSTYEVGTSKAVQNAIAKNGNITIKFYKEREKIQNPCLTVDSNITWYNSYNSYNNNYSNYNIKNLVPTKLYNNYATTEYCASAIDSRDLGDTTLALNNYVDTISNAITGKSIYNYTSANTISKSISTPKSIETGRIEEGSHSNQKFQNVYKDFETWPFKTETIKILPMSQKQVNANDLTKKYCYNCGRKLNQKYNFCPFCGAKQ